jgi:hypothetical protein
MNRTRCGEINCMSSTFSNLIERSAKSFVPPSLFASDTPPKIWDPLGPNRLIATEAGPEPRRLCQYGGRSAGWIPEESWFDSVPGTGNYAPPPRASRPALKTTQLSTESAVGIFSPTAKRTQRKTYHLPPLLTI